MTPGAGYSDTPLARKLGIDPGMTVALIDAPPDLPDTLAAPEGVRLRTRRARRARRAAVLELGATPVYRSSASRVRR